MEPKPKNPGGRPRIPDEKKLIQRSIRLSAEDWAKIDENGGLNWLRQAVRRAKPAKK